LYGSIEIFFNIWNLLLKPVEVIRFFVTNNNNELLMEISDYFSILFLRMWFISIFMIMKFTTGLWNSTREFSSFFFRRVNVGNERWQYYKLLRSIRVRGKQCFGDRKRPTDRFTHKKIIEHRRRNVTSFFYGYIQHKYAT